jgi:hypothetical protein
MELDILLTHMSMRIGLCYVPQQLLVGGGVVRLSVVVARFIIVIWHCCVLGGHVEKENASGPRCFASVLCCGLEARMVANST